MTIVRWTSPLDARYAQGMAALRALVKDGRLHLDEPTALPEGMVLDLVVDDEGDDLDEAERTELHAHLQAAYASAQAGRLRPADEILRELRARG